MLPLVTEDIREKVFSELVDNLQGWRKEMIHFIKEENPEINQAIINVAEVTSLDPKAVATGAYMVYKMIEFAAELAPTMPEEILEME